MTKRWPVGSPSTGRRFVHDHFDGDRLAADLARVFIAHDVPVLESVP